MFKIERHQKILDILHDKKSITVKNLSKEFYIGETTIRRDLEFLESLGLVKRTYGGAVLIEGINSEIPISVREHEQKSEKYIIGEYAASLVQDGDIIIIDSSSTALKTIPFLKKKSNLTIISNSAKIGVKTQELTDATVYCTGGRLRENSLSYIGEIAKSSISRFFIDKLFLSSRSLHMSKGITDLSEEEASLRKIMIEHSSVRILLCDHTKFDRVSFSKIGDFSNIDYIITDLKPSQEWLSFFQSKNIKVISPNN